MKSFSLIVPSFGVLACAVSVASAQVLMLDFGPTAATDSALTNSPYHTENPGFTGSTWNTVGVADVTSGLKWSDGSSATSVTLNLGATTQDSSTTIGLANTPSNGTGLTGSAISTGVYAGDFGGARTASSQAPTPARSGRWACKSAGSPQAPTPSM